MARTRTPGITVDLNGNLAINKEVRGKRLFVRVGRVSQDEAEARLQKELERLDVEWERSRHARPLFRDHAARYLAESRNKRSGATITWHVPLLISYFGSVEPHKIRDATLVPFVSDRLAKGASATTINRSLELLRVPVSVF
jgi:hypothetical protein